VFAGIASFAGGLKEALRVASGVVVIALGLNLIFDFAKFLNLEKRFHPDRPHEGAWAGLAGAFLLGVAFAAGWSPCIGPILAAILLLAAREESLWHAALLLFSYSLGLALPFLAAGAAFDRMKPLMDRAKRNGLGLRIAAGLLLIGLGLLMATGKLGAVSAIASRAGFGLADAAAAAPGRATLIDIAILAAIAAALALPRLFPRRKAFSTARIACIAALALAAAGEAAGLWSLARLVASWLGFQGG
jgi:cytochrome c-type biogenesis protein